MTDKEFCYWLQGFVELNGEAPTKEQWASIKEHLALVFTKVTPPLPPTTKPSPYPFDSKQWDFDTVDKTVAIC